MLVKIKGNSSQWSGQRLVAGQVVDMPDETAKVFIATNQAAAVVDAADEPAAESKAKPPKARPPRIDPTG